ncbi:MAG: DNA replication protein [Bacillota bacterium]
MATNEKNCILGENICNLAGVDGKCNRICPSFISLHGASGIGGRIAASNIPQDYRLSHTKNTPVRKSEPEIYKIIDQYVKSFDRMFDEITDPDKKIKGLFLFSENTGNGKTSSGCAILNTWIIKDFLLSAKAGKHPTQRPAYFLSMMEFHTLYNTMTRPGVPEHIKEEASEKYYDQMEIAKNVPLLMMDDLGVRTDVSDAFRGDIHSIVEYRVSQLKPTIYSSNIPISELNSVFIGDKGRLADRVREGTLEVHFTSESKRGMRRPNA